MISDEDALGHLWGGRREERGDGEMEVNIVEEDFRRLGGISSINAGDIVARTVSGLSS